MSNDTNEIQVTDDEIKLFLSTEEIDPVSAAIRWFTRCQMSHTGWIRMKDQWTYSAMSDGHGLTWRKPNPRAKILIVDVPGTKEAFTQALEWEGAKYDFLDILGIITGRDWSKPGEFICDKAVFCAYKLTGHPLLNPNYIPVEHWVPAYVLLSPYITGVYDAPNH